MRFAFVALACVTLCGRAVAQERQEAEICKEKAKGFLGTSNVADYNRCMDEFARQRRERAAAQAIEDARARAERDAAEQAAREREEAERQRRADERQAQEKAEREQFARESAAADAEEERAEAALRKACGKDYMRVAVGMSFKRVRQCAGEFELQGQFSTKYGPASLYEAAGGFVWVVDGKVVMWRKSR